MSLLPTALIQLNSGPEIAGNIATATALIRKAAGQGARFILTPENTCHILSPLAEKLKTAPEEKDHPALKQFSVLAAELGVWILVGSVSVKVTTDKIANRSYVLNDKGIVAAWYDKIHLFDVDLPTGESHRESAVVQPGTRAVVALTPWAGVGMSICYDVRFAYLYRVLAKAGAKILTVPSAFTVPTGKAHWEALLRARAIETGSFVLAPAQTGTHHNDRKTYGHSLIINPWGDVMADGGDDVGIIRADLDLADVERARAAIPSLSHDRAISL
jgi:predicted amidohydrolase